MKFYAFLTLAIMLTSNIVAQDKTKAKEFDQIDDAFIRKVNRIANAPNLEDEVFTKVDYSLLESDSSRVNIKKRLEATKGELKFYQDLPYWGLKDKIKQIKITRYLAASDKKKNIIERKNNGDVSIAVNFQKVTFDENGYPRTYLETSINKGISKTISKESLYIGPQLFEEIETNEAGVYLIKYMGIRRNFEVFFKEKNGKKVGEINMFINEKKKLVINNYLDAKSNNTVETKTFKNNLPVAVEQKISGKLNYKSDSKYNQDNSLKEIKQIIVDTKPFTRVYKYTQKDSHSNWTERVCYNSDNVPMWIEKAEYEYLFEDSPSEINTDIIVSADSIAIQQDVPSENIE